MAELATGYISLVASTDKIPGQIRAAFGQAEGIARQQGQRAGNSFASAVGSNLKKIGAVVGVTGGIAAVSAAMKSAISSGMDFTTSLNTMQAVAGASSAQVAQVAAEARRLGTDNQLAATSSVDAAQAMVELAKGGFNVDQSMKAARGTLQLAAAAQIDAATAATIQSQALQAFGKEASYAGKASDILANAANASSAEIVDVAAALQQSGTVANQFGLSMTDTAAAISMMANAGIQGSDAGTLLKSALLALTDQGKPAQGAIEELGLTVYDAQGKFVGMSTLFGQLQDASKRMSAEQYQAATAVLFGSDAMRIAGIAAQQGKSGFDAMRAAMEQQGSAADVAAAKMQGLPGAWERLVNSAEDAGLAFYDAVEGPLSKAALAGSDAIESIVSSASSLGKRLSTAFSGDSVQSALKDLRDRTSDTFSGLFAALGGLAPEIGTIAVSLAQASAALGVSGWQILLTTLQAATTVLNTLNPILSATADILDSNQVAVVALVGAYAAFKTIPSLMGRVTSAVSPLATRTQGAASSMRDLASAQGAVMRTSTYGAIQMGRFGSSIAQVGQSAPLVARMQQSFVNAATGADRFGRTAGIAAAAGTGLRAAGSGIAGVFGGPVGLALTGAAVAGGAWAASVAQQKQLTDSYNASLQSLAENQKATGQALLATRGSVTADVYKGVTAQVDDLRASIDTDLELDAKWTNVASDWFAVATGRGNSTRQWANELDGAADAAGRTKGALDGLNMTSDEMSKAIAGSPEQWNTLTARLNSMGEGGRRAADRLQALRDTFVQQQGVAQRVSPGIQELGEALRVMGDKSASSSDKLNALKAAMDAMTPARSKTEALSQYGETIRKVANVAAEGIDPGAFKGGNLDAMSEAGANLSRTLQELADKSAQVASTGGNMQQIAAQNEQAFQQLATATGQPIQKIRELYNEMGGGKALDLIVQLQGAPEVVQDLGEIRAAWAAQPDKKTIDIQSGQVSQQTRNMLTDMGVKIDYLQGGKVLSIDVQDASAQAKVALLTQNVSVLAAMKANPQVDLNTLQFQAKNAESRAALQSLAGMSADPHVGAVITDLLQGHAVSMQKLDELSKTVANPQARMEIEKIMANIATVNKGLDDTARSRTVSFRIQMPDGSFASPAFQGDTYNGPGRANGGIDYGRNGVRIAAFAAGGMRTLENPQILPGRGNGQLVETPAGPARVAEGETTAEAWIPFAQSKRSRSTSILAAVAKAFGYSLVPQENLPGSLSGMLGAISGMGVKALAVRAGADRIAKFALGGFRTADEVNRFPRDEGLEGAPYVWGGVHWGDCSGAMSAIARYAVGLDPWGGRFATASQQDALLKMGFQMGPGSSGDLTFGWVNGGPGGGHTAGQLPDGTNVEMGGNRGNGQVGGAAAGPGSFPNQAHLRLAAPWSDAGTDDGGWVQRPDGTWVQLPPGVGVYGSSGSGVTGGYSGGSGSGDDKSLSGRLGGVASAFVSGQVKSLLDVLSVNDSPGILGAVAEYENQLRQSQQSGSSSSSVPKEVREQAKQQYDAEKQQLKAQYESEKLQRTQDYERQRQAIVNDYTAKKISQAEYERKLNELKHQHESDELSKKQAYDAEVERAKTDYESKIGKTGSDAGLDTSGQSLEAKQQFENEKLALKQQYDQERADRKATYDAALDDLQLQRKNKQITKEQYEAKSAELKAKYDADVQSMKVKHDNAELEKKQEYDRLSSQLKSQNGSSLSAPSITDPGTQRPAPGQDLGGAGLPTTGNAVKDAFRSGLREVWRQGQPWTDTDWIINKESTWNPTARNGKYFGLAQLGPEAWAASGIAPTDDPRLQGTAYDKYVGPRYGDPMAARKHHEAKNWYDDGGAAIGTGLMAKNIIEPERVLSPRQTAAFEEMVRRDFQGGGNDQLIAKLDQLIELMAKTPRGQVNYNLPADRGVERVQRIADSRQRAGLAAF